jgi:hypothetical protein
LTVEGVQKMPAHDTHTFLLAPRLTLLGHGEEDRLRSLGTRLQSRPTERADRRKVAFRNVATGVDEEELLGWTPAAKEVGEFVQVDQEIALVLQIRDILGHEHRARLGMGRV